MKPTLSRRTSSKIAVETAPGGPLADRPPVRARLPCRRKRERPRRRTPGRRPKRSDLSRHRLRREPPEIFILLEPPRRQGLAFSSFLCGLCAFAVQISGTAKVGRPRSGREYANARIRPARWRKFPTCAKKIVVGTAKTPRARRFSCFFFFPLRPLRLRGSNLRNRQRGPSAKRTRIHECTNTPGRRPKRSDLSRHRPRHEPPRFSSLTVSRGSVRFLRNAESRKCLPRLAERRH